MKLTRIFALVAIAVMAVSCYETYESVAPRKVYDDEAFEAQFPEAQHITIAELKYAFGTISNTGVNSGWGNTKSMLIGEDIFEKKEVYIKVSSPRMMMRVTYTSRSLFRMRHLVSS